ncbi:MAG TPA: TetR/AcrR family transcriptional regulator [Jatrophihabitantaceae bacterium]
MPKVSEAYLLERRQHILDSARRTFARNGFHATSMQDLFAASGLSAGAFYRYFDSKSAIISAIARESMGEVVGALTAVTEQSPTASIGAALGAAMEMLAQKDDAEHIAGLAIQAWAEALRDDELAAQLSEVISESRAKIAKAVRRLQRSGALPSGISADSLMSLFLAVLPGFLVQRATLGPDAVAGMPAAARALWPPLPSG